MSQQENTDITPETVGPLLARPRADDPLVPLNGVPPQPAKDLSPLQVLQASANRGPRGHPPTEPLLGGSKIKIAATIMVKNEHARILSTLKTLVGFVTGMIIYDTGSTDDTLEIIEGWCQENQVRYHVKRGEFVDFSTSRNVLLDFADECCGPPGTTENSSSAVPPDAEASLLRAPGPPGNPEPLYQYLLLLDCNDELQGGPKLLQECEKYLNLPEKVFMIRQLWLAGISLNKYRNSRLVKAHHGWRYKKRVHEYLCPPEGRFIELASRPNICEEVILYQNRNEDDDKTMKRFQRDKAMLVADVQKDKDPRDFFYLAQTLSCLQDFFNSYYWYKKRSCIIGAFDEERYQAHMRMADLVLNAWKKPELAFLHYFHAASLDFRAEPLVGMAKILRGWEETTLAYCFLSAACKLEFPIGAILFIDDACYRFDRFFQLGIVAYYHEKYREGRWANLQAQPGNPELVAPNQKFYLDKPDTDKPSIPWEDLPIELEQMYQKKLIEGSVASKEIGPAGYLNEEMKDVLRDDLGFGEAFQASPEPRSVDETQVQSEPRSVDGTQVSTEPPQSSEAKDGETKEPLKAKFEYADPKDDHPVLAFVKAFQLTHHCPPLILLAEYSRSRGGNKLAWCLAEFACQLDSPPNPDSDYEYARHSVLSKLGFQFEVSSSEFIRGRAEAVYCLEKSLAISQERNVLLEYTKKEKAAKSSNQKVPVKSSGGSSVESVKSPVFTGSHLSVENRSGQTRDQFVKQRAAQLTKMGGMNHVEAVAQARREWQKK